MFDLFSDAPQGNPTVFPLHKPRSSGSVGQSLWAPFWGKPALASVQDNPVRVKATQKLMANKSNKENTEEKVLTFKTPTPPPTSVWVREIEISEPVQSLWGEGSGLRVNKRRENKGEGNKELKSFSISWLPGLPVSDRLVTWQKNNSPQKHPVPEQTVVIDWRNRGSASGPKANLTR